jgi:5'/3'-nucleotidase SurE
MRILVTNDDGIHAEGLDVCARIAAALSDDVWVVAPEFDQSGVSHSLSLNDPLRLRKVDERRFAIKGTPTDCVMAVGISRRQAATSSVRRQSRSEPGGRRDLFRHRGRRSKAWC